MDAKKLNWVLIIIIILLIGIYIGEKLKNSKSELMNKSELQKKEQSIQSGVIAPLPPGIKINTRIFQMKFEPSSAKVKGGERIYLIVKNDDQDWYNLVWDREIENNSPSAGIIGSGQEITYILTAPQKPGTYYFYSSRPEHKIDLKSKTGTLFELIVE